MELQYLHNVDFNRSPWPFNPSLFAYSQIPVTMITDMSYLP